MIELVLNNKVKDLASALDETRKLTTTRHFDPYTLGDDVEFESTRDPDQPLFRRLAPVVMLRMDRVVNREIQGKTRRLKFCRYAS